MTSDIQQRFTSISRADPGDKLRLRIGTLTDYKGLKEHHYRADRPATATRVLTLVRSAHTATDRFTSTPARDQPVAVLLESLPSLSCTMRNYALNDRYGNWLTPRQQATLLNLEVRVISRVVVHPCWRGIGLAVRLVRAALQTPTTRYTEALAAMGRVNPFFQRAGMTAYPRPQHACDARLIQAMQSIGLNTVSLALTPQLSQRIKSLSTSTRDWFYKELYRWYRQNDGRSIAHSTDPSTHLQAARERLMLDPVYYLHDNSALVP